MRTRDRLLRALAEAYFRATWPQDPARWPEGFDPQRHIEWLARMLGESEAFRRQAQADMAPSIAITLGTTEALELVDLLGRYPHEQADREARWEDLREVWRVHRAAARELHSRRRGPWIRKASAALQCFGFLRGPRTPPYNWRRIAFAYRQLTEGYFDPATQTHHPAVSPCEALQQLAEHYGSPSAGAVRKGLQRHGMKGLPADC